MVFRGQGKVEETTMRSDLEPTGVTATDDAYFDYEHASRNRVFDSDLLRSPVSVLRARTPLIFSLEDSADVAMRDMQRRHRGCVLVTSDGTAKSRLCGIFTERDVLLRIIGAGVRPDNIALGDVMTPDPEGLPLTASVAWALNKMSVGGFRHVPVVDGQECPSFVVSAKDVIQFLVEAFPSEILNLPPEFGAPCYRTRDGA
jgi:CBS domain-containing protein